MQIFKRNGVSSKFNGPHNLKLLGTSDVFGTLRILFNQPPFSVSRSSATLCTIVLYCICIKAQLFDDRSETGQKRGGLKVLPTKDASTSLGKPPPTPCEYLPTYSPLNSLSTLKEVSLKTADTRLTTPFPGSKQF